MKTKERLITVSDAFRVLRRFWLLILVCTLLFGAAGYLYAARRATEYYTASSQVYFQTATADMLEGPDANEIARARALATSCCEAFPNDQLITNVRAYFTARRADRPNESWEDLSAYTDAQIKGMLSATVPGSSQTVTISAQAPSASLACHLANAVAGELQASVVDIIGNCKVTPFSAAGSAIRNGGISKKPAVLAAVLGAALSYVALFVYAFVDPRVQTVGDVINTCGEVTLLGTVPTEEGKKGAKAK